MRINALATVIFGITANPFTALADSNGSVRSAYALCSVIDGTGMASAPCEVSGWGSSVTTTLDTSSGEARKLCGQVANLMRSKGLTFDSGWTFQIKSPYSGDNSIAFCNL
ncbi:hypothetical protein [Ensifer aridi]|uniref:hypothetical protein n=1 Tax=Ensifer aridi TaxID=1708715 RepID=UPI00358FDFF3